MDPYYQIDTSNELIERQLVQSLISIGEAFEADVLTLRGGLVYGTDDLVRNAVEEIDSRQKKLLVVLETEGGSIDVAERLANLFRNHYAEVDFLIPNFAFSAGTILAMSGDNIWMDYYSVLGPIDPQVRKEGVGWVPALGYLAKYNELIEKSRIGLITSAEVAFLCQKFDPAELHAFEQAKEQSLTLLKEWLVRYKFKDWATTDTRRLAVTEQMKQSRAMQIAEMLNSTELWHSHSRGISMLTLQEKLNLRINNFGVIESNRVIRTYYKLLRDYMNRREYSGVVHTKEKLTPTGA